MTLSTELGFPIYSAWGSVLQGWALGEQGHHESGRELLQKGLSLLQESGFVRWVPFYLGFLAELYGKSGRVEEGLSVVSEAHGISTKRGARWCEAELYRLKGELTLQAKVQDLKSKVEEKAEECFHKAIEVARQQEAKSWELRAVMSLSRLWQQQGKRKEAHETLAEIYGWFTEGFDTKDLQEAKALIEELSH